jgi:quinone-modifying oxidoreductase subunit QmoC
MDSATLIKPDSKFIKELKNYGANSLKKCYQCSTCTSVCSLSPENKPFPRKEMIYAQWGQINKLVNNPDIWVCYQCTDCSTHCPRGARPSDVLSAIRFYVFKYFAFPSFMGKALASPKALPLLLLFPMIVILALFLAYSGGDFSFINEKIKFSNFLSHIWLEFLFIGGNILVFLFAFISLNKFWKMLKTSHLSKDGPGFILSLILTIKEILLHTKFFKCKQSTDRNYAHLLVFFGFFGAMATAGLAVLAMILYKIDPSIPFTTLPPIPMSHPIKWLGNASGLIGILGLSIIVIRRIKDKYNSYTDWIFLLMLLLVFVTGFGCQFLRLADTAILAYSIYYVHLVLVFFILWYAPYSKFAHMFYRTIGLVYARTIARESKSDLK